jgi:hypothetical protein
MDIAFLTPQAALFAISALVPLAAFVVRERRGIRIRAHLGLAEPRRFALLALVLALLAVPALLAVAAAQPVVESTRSVPERVDAEAFIVIDTSRSMLASARPGSPTRIERARVIADRLRARFPEVPAGIASLTDRLLPHVFPTTDTRVFQTALAESIDVERPPPEAFYTTVATGLDQLAVVPERRYFSPTATKRLLLVLTDGETRPVGSELARAFSRRPQVKTIFIRMGNPDERIYVSGVPEGAYRPLPGSETALTRTAALVGGQAFSEQQVDAAGDAAVADLGSGKTKAHLIEGERKALMPYLALAALLPLGFVLLRRNL